MTHNAWPYFQHLGDFEEVVSSLQLPLGVGSSGVPGKHKAIRFGSHPEIEAGYSGAGNPVLKVPGLSKPDLEHLAAECQDLLATETRWFTVAMEVAAVVEGVFAAPQMRIRPAPNPERWISPTESFPPRARLTQGEPVSAQALLVDVAYESTPANPFVDFRRRDRAAREAEGLVMLGLWPMPKPLRRSTNPSFALLWDAAASEQRSARLHWGFNHPELTGSPRLELSALPEIALLPEVEHMRFARGPLDLVPSHRVWVHEGFARMVETARSFETSERQALGRALCWLEVGNGSTSPTLQVVAYACAIEALLPPGPVETCAECGLANLKISSRFKAFVRRYASADDSRGFLDLVYGARSQLVHGSLLYEIDEGPFASMSSGYHDSLASRWVARAAIVNWLWERSSDKTQASVSKRDR